MSTAPLAASGQGSSPSAPQGQPEHVVAWDAAFQDGSGNLPIHLTAHYVDARGQSHRFEEWRLGVTHLRRKTDNRIDLHADAEGHAQPGQSPDYVWQILDLQKQIAHRVSTPGMLRLGMLYSYYSMAHLLTRPAGRLTVQRSTAPVSQANFADVRPLAVPSSSQPCTWWQIDAAGERSTRVCWVSRYGVPAQTWSQSAEGWRLMFVVDSLDTRAIPGKTFQAVTTGFQVRNVDDIENAD